LERKDRKALAAAVAVLFVFGMSSGANALTIANLGWFGTSVSSHVTQSDLSVSFAKLKELSENRDSRHYTVQEILLSLHNRIHLVDRNDDCGAAAPEPSAALVFGLGLLVASRFHRRKR